MSSLLFDQGLPRSVVTILKSRGRDASHVADLGLSNAGDMDIIRYAQKEGMVIVTLDADFHALLKTGGQSAPSVIRLRLEGLKGKELADLIEQILAVAGNDLAQGALVTVNLKTIRVHRL